jgi:hypothetical protein
VTPYPFWDRLVSVEGAVGARMRPPCLLVRPCIFWRRAVSPHDSTHEHQRLVRADAAVIPSDRDRDAAAPREG